MKSIMKTIESILQARYSCRAYQAQQVPQETIQEILDQAQRSASWCNVQPWEILLLGGEATRRFGDAYYEHVQSHPANPDFPWPERYEGVYQQRRRECGYALYNTLEIKKEDREATQRQMLENYRFFGAPHLALITTPKKLGVYGAVDCGIYVANFMALVQSHRLACIAQAAVASHPDFVRDYFNLPEDRLLVCGIAFGYEDATQKINQYRTTRDSIDHVVRWEGFN
ncbi:MAG: nitroreductase [Alcaligenaceae bacterium]|uniref:Nitroreductase n=2 Tax=Neopusillimonas maritima TaxID=2026239 RepID=A0ABX9MTT2_9BURK|nr:nitroreductase [Alcaligenaceae bacterium]RII82320.1 nitroreductase [Neopusillimonas maritima]